jgi:hypothetical protein
MNNKVLLYLRSRHRDASNKSGYILDVTKLKSDGTGSKIVLENTLDQKYLRSLNYYIVSLNTNTYDRAIDMLTSDSNSRIRTPVPKRTIEKNSPVVSSIKIDDLPEETLRILAKIELMVDNN